MDDTQKIDQPTAEIPQEEPKVVPPPPQPETKKVEEIVPATPYQGIQKAEELDKVTIDFINNSVDKKEVEAVRGEIVEDKPKHPGGRPTKYNEEMLKKTQYYFDLCRGKIDNQQRFPYIEELAMELEVDDDTINEWTKENAEYSAAIKNIKNLQKLRLLQRGFKATNPTFSIFLLKVNHGYIETEKRILAGERNSDPLQVAIKEYTPASEIAKHIADSATQ